MYVLAGRGPGRSRSGSGWPVRSGTSNPHLGFDLTIGYLNLKIPATFGSTRTMKRRPLANHVQPECRYNAHDRIYL